MTKGRREHYVPVLYLRQFGEILNVFDKKTCKTFPSTPKDIALEKGFYDLAPNIDLEGLIAKNEKNLSPGLMELIDKQNPASISGASRERLSVFIAMQYVRTKDVRASIQEMGGKLATALVNSEPRFKDIGAKVTMSDELAQALHAQTLVDDTIPKIASRIDKLLWVVMKNNTKTSFWTSDSPVVLLNPVVDKGLGIGVPGIQVYFPLNVELLLCMLDSDRYSSPAVKILKEQQVVYSNDLQLYNASRFVITSKDDFARAKELWKKDEVLRKPKETTDVRTIKKPQSTLFEMTKKPAGPR